MSDTRPWPLIDDQYWFDFAKKLADTSIERRDSAAAALQSLVTWLWGIYTAATATGFALAEKRLSVGATALVAAGSVSLVVVYWATVWVKMPPLVQFDPRVPEQIQKAYTDIVKKKQRRLSLTLLLSTIAAGAVSVGLLVATVTAEKKVQLPTLTALLSKNGLSGSVAITTNVGAATVVEVTAIASNGSPAAAVHTLAPSTDGLIQTSIPLIADVGDKLEAVVRWSDPKGRRFQMVGRVENDGH